MIRPIVASIAIVAGSIAFAEDAPDPWVWRATTTVNLTATDGVNPGTIFEATDAEGRTVAGAGFLGAYNTYTRTDPTVLQFFVKPTSGDDALTRVPLPRPTPSTNHYLFDEDGRAFAYDRTGAYAVRQWQPDKGTWLSVDRPRTPATPIGNHRLTFAGNEVHRDGVTVMRLDPAIGSAGRFYFAYNTLLFQVSQTGTEETYLYGCPWDPATEATVPIDSAIILPLAVPREFPYSYGQLDGAVIVGTNNGGVHRFREGHWDTLRHADPAVSFQLYTMVNYYDRLLMGQYPTGELFEIRGDEVVPIPGWPPQPENVSAAAREAQTLTIYRGELFAGIWPWGELWRLPGSNRPWEWAGRLFSQPAMTPDVQEPYSDAMAAMQAPVANLWGQRVTGMIASGPNLIVSTANKNGAPFEGAESFLPPVAQREYGAVYQMTLPGHLSTQLNRVEGPTYLEFRIRPDAMTVTQDGVVIAELDLEPITMEGYRIGRVQWGRGLFGPAARSPENYAVDTPSQWNH